MNKGDLIDHVSDRAGISKAAADKAMEAVLAGITDSLRKGERVTFVGFGTFSISNRKARKRPQSSHRCRVKNSCHASR